jgi:hypothetical protein
MYSHLCSSVPGNPHTKLWKAKIPLKIKIFMWLVENNSILTRDNLSRRGWQGDQRCAFCLENESIIHLYFDCSMARYIWSLIAYVVGANVDIWAKRFLPLGGKFLYVGLAAICWALWRTRNNICFDNKVVRSPTEIICLASSFIPYWAELQPEGDRQKLEDGAALKEAALHFHPHEAQAGDTGVVLLH